MIIKKLISQFKNSCTINLLADIKGQYDRMSNLELINLLSSSELWIEAEQIARSILVERLNLKSGFSPSEAFDVELERIIALSKMCHVCGGTNPSQNHEFFICQKAGRKVNWSHLISVAAANLVTMPLLDFGLIPFGNTSQNYQAIKLSLFLCSGCGDSTKQITKDMCNKHPFVEYYILLGFNEVMLPTELAIS